MMQCVAVCCSVFVLRLMGVMAAVYYSHDYSVLQYVALCCSVSQCVAVCCSVLQCVSSNTYWSHGCSVLQS